MYKLKINYFIFLLCSNFFLFSFCQSSLASDLKADLSTQQQLLTINLEVDQVHYAIHFRRYQQAFALKVKSILEQYVAKIHTYFNYRPKTTVHFSVNDREEDSNGLTTPFPYNLVYLNNFPPIDQSSLAGSTDWVRTLVIHEYTHTITLDMTFGGLDFFRTFFGSTMKWAGINPRWFLEGIATWAESYFTGEGRINFPLLANQFDALLKSHLFSMPFTDWDDPLTFPYGSTAYWYGGYFLHFLETKEPGLLACWARSNGGSVPFFVSSRFRECDQVYGNLNEAYEAFKKEWPHFLTEKVSKQISSCPFKDPIFCELLGKETLARINFFKGYVENEQLVAVILNDGKKGGAGASYSERLLVATKKPMLVKSYKFSHSIESIFPRQKIEPEKLEKNASSAFLTTLKPNPNLSVQDKLLLSLWSNEQVGETRIFKEIDLNTRKVSSLPKEQCSFSYWKSHALDQVEALALTEENTRILKNAILVKMQPDPDKGGYWCLYYDQKNWQWWHSLPNIARAVTLETKVAENKKDKNTKKEKKLLKEIDQDPTKENKEIEEKEVVLSSYQPWRYLTPQYLFVDYLATGLIDSFSLSTSLTDPKNRHAVGLSLTYNTPVDANQNPWTHLLSYSYQPGLWQFYLADENYYYLFSNSNKNESLLQESSMAQVSYRLNLGRWAYIPSVFWRKTKEQDIFADRSITSLHGSQELNFMASDTRSNLRSWTFIADLGEQKNTTLNHGAFTTLELKNQWLWHYGPSWQQQWTTAWGKMFKHQPSLADGTFYGGGVANGLFLRSSSFPSYVIGQGQLFGQEMFSTMMRFDWTSFYFYEGKSTYPFYFKTLGPLFGLEYFYGDYLLSLNHLSTDPHYLSAFAGFKSSWNLFFLLPLDIEGVYAKSLTGDQQLDQFQLLFQTSLIW